MPTIFPANRHSTTRAWLYVIFAIAAAIFALILIYDVTLFEKIPYNWKIAIIAFMIFLPFAFFVQAFLHSVAMQTELGINSQRILDSASIAIQQERAEKSAALERFSNDIHEKGAELKRLRQQMTAAMSSNTSSAELKELQDQEKFLKRVIVGNTYSIEHIGRDLKKDAKVELLNDDKPIDIKEVSRLLQARGEILKQKAPEAFGVYNEASELLKRDLARAGFEHDEINISGIISPDKERHNEKELRAKLADLLNFRLGEYKGEIRTAKMREQGLDFGFYILPLTFFLFTFFASSLLILPLTNSIFTGHSQTIALPLFNTGKSIPLIVVEWGVLGGLVYTSINLLNRFLRKDIVPQVYFMASMRLLYSGIVAIVIYFIYIFAYATSDSVAIEQIPPQILLVAFFAGISPIQFLVHFANSHLLAKLELLTRKKGSGDKPITEIDGINLLTSSRLYEEGIDSVSDLALCDVPTISTKTRYPIETVLYWKDQAIFFTLTGDIYFKPPDASKEESLHDILDRKYGINTWSAFSYFIHDNLYGIPLAPANVAGNTPPPNIGQLIEQAQKSFFKNVGIMKDDSGDIAYARQLFDILYIQGQNYAYNYSNRSVQLTRWSLTRTTSMPRL